MTLTVRDAFDGLLSRIELNPTRVALASRRYNAVKNVIETALPGKQVRQIGSFQRSTKIRPQDLGDCLDVDAVVSFGDARRRAAPGEEGVTPQSAMETVRSALRSNEVYRVMDPKADAPTVILEYEDPDGFKIELVPAFVNRIGLEPPPGRPDSYLVAKANDWEIADYDYDAAVISNANEDPRIGGALVSSIKIIKAYLRSRNVPLNSFHVEVLTVLSALPVLRNWNGLGLPWGYHHVLTQFLTNVPSFLTGPVSLPGSLSSAMDSGLSVHQLQSIGAYLSGRAAEGRRLCELSDGSQAVRAWHDFFGEPFPAV